MMMRPYLKYTLILNGIFLLCSSCLQKENDPEKEGMDQFFLHMEGTWKMDNAQVYERWWESDGSYVAEGFILDGDDTLKAESITLEHKGGNVFYTAEVTDQNRGNPVRFRMVSYDSLRWVFENPEHDFPTRIEYQFLGKDSVVAIISGKEDAQEKRIRFKYVKQ